MDPDTRRRWQQDTRYSWATEMKALLSLRQRLTELMCGHEFMDQCLCPVNFERTLKRATFQRKHTATTDLTPNDVRDMVTRSWKTLLDNNVLRPTLKVEALFWDWCSTKTIWDTYKLDRAALSWFLSTVHHVLLTKSIATNESGGEIAAQHSGSELTQMTLKTFHFAGSFSSLVGGIPRMKEIIGVVKNPKTPCMVVPVKAPKDITEVGREITQVLGQDLVDRWQTTLPSAQDRNRSFMNAWSRWNNVKEDVPQLYFIMNKEAAIMRRVSPRKLCAAMRHGKMRKKMKDFDTLFAYADLSEDVWWVSINMSRSDAIWTSSLAVATKHAEGVEPSDDMVYLVIYERIIDCLVCGIADVVDFCVDKKAVTQVAEDGKPHAVMTDVIYTAGSNLLMTLNNSDVDSDFVSTNHLYELYQTLGIDAACAAIEHEWRRVMIMNDTHVSTRHIKLIAETMCFRGFVCPMTYQGICRESSSIIKKASFEKAMDSFVWGAARGQCDKANGAMDSICWNGVLQAGTGCVTLVNEKVTIPPCVQRTKQQARYVPPTMEVLYDNFLKPKQRKSISAAPKNPGNVHIVQRTKTKKKPTTIAPPKLRIAFASGTTFTPSSPPPVEKVEVVPPFTPWTP